MALVQSVARIKRVGREIAHCDQGWRDRGRPGHKRRRGRQAQASKASKTLFNNKSSEKRYLRCTLQYCVVGLHLHLHLQVHLRTAPRRNGRGEACLGGHNAQACLTTMVD